MVVCETTSNRDPVAISMNRAKSVRDARELPSAMLDEMETDARRNWLVNPNRCYSGEERVNEYTRSAILQPSTSNLQH